MTIDVQVGQVWRSRATGNRFRVVEVFGEGNFGRVSVEALDGGRFGAKVGDNCYAWLRMCFLDGTMELLPAGA